MAKGAQVSTALLEAHQAVETANQALGTAKLMAREFVASFPESRQLIVARSFCHVLVQSWWRSLAGSSGPMAELREHIEAFEMVELPLHAIDLATSIGEIASRFDTETAAYEIGLIYTAMLPSEHRGNYGVFYTPPALTERLIELVTIAGVNWKTSRVLDPACGGGAFLAPIASRVIAELGKSEPEKIINNIASRLQGYEIDPFAAWLSQVALDAVVLPIAKLAGKRLPVLVTVCDSLRKSVDAESFDLVIGNPPYSKVKLDSGVRELYKRSLYGHANLYGLFTDLALRNVKSGGIIAYVTPTSFLAGVYFKNLRKVMGGNAPLVMIDFVETRKNVFDDVLQETALAIYKAGEKSSSVLVSEISLDSDGLVISNVATVELPEECSRPWIMPRNKSQGAIVGNMAKMPSRLADWGYTVSTGPLVWNRHKPQLAFSPGKNRYPLIWAEAITSDGRFVFRAEKKNHAPFFSYEPGNESLIITRSCVLLQRTTAKEQARRLIAALLPTEFVEKYGAVVIENHINMIRPLIDNPPVSAEVVSAFLNSRAADAAFRCVSGSVAVSAYELESLPLPSPKALAPLKKLVAELASKEAIDAACDKFYLRKA
ncbi:HsdM family class I SAM-dependent methyltransferase [Pseudomonas asiatica]|uniref:HsdM family class I SAM-dependent methyltransferase n=1 Tax=Pseudomonas asiatica TaxID=2219225 RepID=UPI0011D3FAEC|nr:N-6 DNA methylase [Pseudomonas asiatica]TXG97464.1 MAG: SAM-dependent methyltransferase [Nevskiaceae bacterium]